MEYFDKLYNCLKKHIITGGNIDDVIKLFKQTHNSGNTLWFIGNGGSSSIASHMAIDYTKNGHIKSQAFNDVAAITCMGNDLGYENIFSQQLSYHIRNGDVLVAISSSGKSINILNAIKIAKDNNCKVVTFSGFSPDNPLRCLGNINFYVPYSEYGIVEISHLTLLHCMLDMICGVA